MLTKEEFIQLGKDIDKAIKIFSNIKPDCEQLSKEISNYELQEQDLLHDIELSNYSRSERSAFAVKIKEIRNGRRNAKDLLEFTEGIRKSLKDNPQVITGLTGIANKIRAINTNQTDRMYIPRTRTDLKVIKQQGLEARHDRFGKLIITESK